MRAGAVLSVIALASAALVGPAGPCGPGTILGTILLPVFFLSWASSWIVSLRAIVITVRAREQRATLRAPALIAIGLAFASSFLLVDGPTHLGDDMWRRTLLQTGELTLGLWPPAVALVATARAWWPTASM